MATEIYLGYPPQHVIDWIKNHLQPVAHEETRYKYAGDTEWRTKMLSGTIALVDNSGTSTGQIDNPKDIVAIEIGTGTQANPVTSIGNYAFYNCSGLTSVMIPNTVTSIGYAAFSGCSGLTSVTIPNTVTNIGNYAFAYCSGFASMTMPNSVTSIGGNAFYSCNALSEMSMLNFTCDYVKANAYNWGIAVPAKQLVTIQCSDGYVILNDKSQSSDERPILKNGKVLFKTSVGGKWKEEDAIIINGTFNGFSSMNIAVEVIIPSKDAIDNSVTIIGNTAFQGCSRLTSVTIPDSVTSIGYNAFYGCNGLTSVTIPDSVTSIKDYAFYGCSGLTSITIPDSVTSIEGSAFADCRGLTNVTILGYPTINASVFYECQQLSDMSMLNFTCDYVKANAYNWGIAVPAKQLVTIQCSDGYVILNDKSQSSDGKTNV